MREFVTIKITPSLIGWLQAYNQPFPDSKVHGANMGPIWRRQDTDGPHVGPINFTIWVMTQEVLSCCYPSVRYLHISIKQDYGWKQ